MWEEISRFADITSLIMVVISIGGFVWTIIGVGKAKNAAEQSAQIAEQAREGVRRISTVVDIGEVISALEEIKRSHRNGQWEYLPERYARARRMLIVSRKAIDGLTDAQSSSIQDSIATLAGMEDRVERALAKDVNVLSAPRFNATLSNSIDQLVAVLEDIKRLNSGHST